MAEGEPQVGPVHVLDGNGDLGTNVCPGEGGGTHLGTHLGTVPVCQTLHRCKPFPVNQRG